MSKEEILKLHGVRRTETLGFDTEVRHRVEYLKEYLPSTGLDGFVLGISGGVDSTTAGRLCQLACTELREQGYDATFYAVRLPYGAQADEADAQASLAFIQPDEVITVDIKQSTDALHNQLGNLSANPGVQDFNKGNVKARIRMGVS